MLSYHELFFCEALADKPWHCPAGYRSLFLPLLSHFVMSTTWERGERPQQGCGVPTPSLRTTGRALQSQLPHRIKAYICKFTLSQNGITWMSARIKHIAKKKKLRLTSTHCNCSSCSKIGWCFPQKWVIAEKMAHKKKNKTSMRLLILK